MGWREVQAARQYIHAEKDKVRVWRDDELKKAEAKRKKAHADLEEAHKLEIAQIRNSCIEQWMRLDAELLDRIEGAQR